MAMFMKEIAIAFVVSTCAALIGGFLIDAAVSPTAFGVVFPTVIAVLERGEREKNRRREVELRQEVESQVRPAPAEPRENEALVHEDVSRAGSDRSAQEELRVLQQRVALPAIDWRRVAIGAIASIILVSSTLVILSLLAAFLALISNTAVVVAAPMIIAASIMLVTGFWVGRTSAGGGFLGAAVMGSIVGIGVPIVMLFVGAFDQDPANIAWALFVFTAIGIVLASIGGWLGVRRRERVAARP